MSTAIASRCTALAILLAGAATTGGSLRPCAARINFLKGRVEVTRPGTGAPKPAFISMPLAGGDRVDTRDKAECEIVLHDGSVLKMRDSSAMVIAKMEAQAKPPASEVEIRVFTGKVLGCVRKLSSAGSRFHLESPTAVASVRGTVFAVFVEGDSTELDVLRGRVAVSGEVGSEVMVGEGQATVVARGDSARSPAAMAAARAAFIAVWAGAAMKIGSAGAAAAGAWYASTPVLVGGAAVAVGAAAAIIIAGQKDEPPPRTPATRIPGPPGWPQ